MVVFLDAEASKTKLVTDWQYLIQSLILLLMFVGFPMWLARPNKLLLMLTAQGHKGF